MSSASTPQTPGSRLPANNTPRSSGGSWTTIEPPASAYDRSPYTATYSRTSYEPTPEQLARDEARRAYLRRNVYTPLVVAIILIVVGLAALLFLAFGVRTPEARSFIAGLSGLTVILLSIPLIAFMSLLPIAWLALTFSRRQQRQENPETGPMAYRNRLQIWLWQLESFIATAGRATENGAGAVRRPLIQAHARGAYAQAFIHGIRRHFTRSDHNE